MIPLLPDDHGKNAGMAVAAGLRGQRLTIWTRRTVEILGGRDRVQWNLDEFAPDLTTYLPKDS